VSADTSKGSAKGTPRGTARDRALRLLGVRDRSRRELERRLLQAGFHPSEVSDAVDALEAAGLVDDERFARQVAEHRLGVRGEGRRAVLGALLTAGVGSDIAERTVDEHAGDDETMAEVLAMSRARRLAGLDPAVARRRLYSYLVRRGHAPTVAAAAVSRALGDPHESL
jgi:regulatory protein